MVFSPPLTILAVPGADWIRPGAYCLIFLAALPTALAAGFIALTATPRHEPGPKSRVKPLKNEPRKVPVQLGMVSLPELLWLWRVKPEQSPVHVKLLEQ